MKQIEGWDLRVVCTDRGSHATRELGVLMRSPNARGDGYNISSATTRSKADAETQMQLADVTDDVGDIDDATGEYRVRFQFTCKSCGRDLQFRRETMTRVALTVMEARRTSLDLSLLPASLRSS